MVVSLLLLKEVTCVTNFPSTKGVKYLPLSLLGNVGEKVNKVPVANSFPKHGP